MTFLSLAVEKSSLTQQKDVLEYREMCLTMDKNAIVEEMAAYQNDNDDGAYDDEISYLETYQEMYDSEIDSIESQLEAINNEIDGYEKAVQTNVKSECTLKISV